jgi:hypothetical protein
VSPRTDDAAPTEDAPPAPPEPAEAETTTERGAGNTRLGAMMKEDVR